MSETVNRARSTILIIDDDELLRTMMNKYLGRAGYQVLLAENAGSGETEKEMRDLVEYLLSELFVKQEEALEKVRRRRLR